MPPPPFFPTHPTSPEREKERRPTNRCKSAMCVCSTIGRRATLGRARGMGIPSCSPVRAEVGNDRRDHVHLARPHRKKSQVPQGIIAGCYFRSILRKLEAILESKEQGSEGQGCWQAVEPDHPQASAKIHIHICIQIQILRIHISMARRHTCPVHSHTYAQPNAHTCIRTHVHTTKLPYAFSYNTSGGRYLGKLVSSLHQRFGVRQRNPSHDSRWCTRDL